MTTTPVVIWACDSDGEFHIIDNIAALGPPEESSARRPPERKPFSGSLLSPDVLEEERKARGPCITFRAWDIEVNPGRNETCLHVEAHFLRRDGQLCQVVGTTRPLEPPRLPEAARDALDKLCRLLCERCGRSP